MKPYSKSVRTLVLIILLTVFAGVIALPKELPLRFSAFNRTFERVIGSPVIDFTVLGQKYHKEFELKQGLDIKGGMQVVLEADMSQIPELDRITALESAREVIMRRVDLFGINEPVVQSSVRGDQYRILVELAGVTDSAQALELVGTTAELDFRLQTTQLDPTATISAIDFFNQFEITPLTGKQLKRAAVQFDARTNEPVIGLEFNEEGTKIFADLTTQNVNKILGIFLDGVPIAIPTISTPIVNGQAQMSGGFTLEEAKQVAIQLNAGALPVPIKVLEQKAIGASLGQDSVNASVRAGIIGLVLVCIFMIALYGIKGVLACVSLFIYAILTIALYKILGITLTLPGIAGLLLTIGMAVDANILIFERMKEELRMGKPFEVAVELGFGRAWDSIKDANTATILTALVLINPLDFSFLNTSGLVRGFGITLLIGVCVSLFTGIFVTRTFMRLFLKDTSQKGLQAVL